jgi:hypothetical protein
MHDQAILQRRRLDDLRDDLDNLVPPADAGPRCCVVQTATLTTYPTAAASFFYCQIQKLSGSQTEGATPTLTAGGYIFAANTGAAIPPNGTNLIASWVESRWVIAYDG